MRIGRLELGKAVGESHWGYIKAMCGCKIWDFGMYYASWLDKDCKCQACKQYQCICEADDDQSS